MSTLTLCRRAGWLLAAACLAATCGCKPAASPPVGHNAPPPELTASSPVAAAHRPQADDLARFLRASLPAQFKLVDLQNDPPVPLPDTAPGTNAWLYNVRCVFAPAEDMLGAPTPQTAVAFQAAVDELSTLAAWSQAYAGSPYAARYSGLMVEPPSPTQPKLLAVLQAKDQPYAPVYGKLAAEWQVDHWNYEVVDLQPPADDQGWPRAHYPEPVLVQGSPEAAQFLAKVQAAVAAAKPPQAAIEAAYRADLLAATPPGTRFVGQLRYGGSTVPAEVRLSAPPAGADPQQEVGLEVRLPNTPGEAFTYLAQRAQRLPLHPTVAMNADETTPVLTPEGAEPLAQGDLTLHLVRASGKPAHTDMVASQLLLVTQTNAQPANVTLQVHAGRLEGRLNGSGTAQSAFVLSVQQSP